jgi:hypothetical protein
MNGNALMSNRKSSGLIAVLHADRPAPDRADALALYGRFIGDWDADIATYTPDGVRHHGQGEIHFDWILEGRAIQDVWMAATMKAPKPVGSVQEEEPQSGTASADACADSGARPPPPSRLRPELPS